MDTASSRVYGQKFLFLKKANRQSGETAMSVRRMDTGESRKAMRLGFVYEISLAPYCMK